MKKSLLIIVAAVMVALSANAQVKRTAQAKTMEPSAVKLNVTKVSDSNLMNITTVNGANKQMARRAVGDIAASYILDYYNYDGSFVASSSFTIEEASGTIKVFGESEEEDVDFTYNIILKDFTWEGGVAYGFYYEDEGYINIPVQTIGNSSRYGRIVLGAVTSVNGTPAHIGFDMNLLVDEDGTLSIYDAEEELKDAGYDDGEIITGWYSYLPDSEYSAWNMGFDIEFLPINAYMGGYECHIVNGAWGDWTATTHDVYVEDYGTELLVHNFFGLCPISVTIDGDKASIATPVQVESYDYAEDSEDPNYMRIWQWNADFTAVLNPGAITGNVSVLDNGTKVIQFYDVEYREAWTDESGEHEAGNYVVHDLTKYFMVHTNYGETGAYFWGEAQRVYIVIPGEDTAINNVKNNQNNVVKTYNLMGQQISNDTKGLIIRDGKKFVNK